MLTFFEEPFLVRDYLFRGPLLTARIFIRQNQTDWKLSLSSRRKIGARLLFEGLLRKSWKIQLGLPTDRPVLTLLLSIAVTFHSP